MDWSSLLLGGAIVAIGIVGLSIISVGIRLMLASRSDYDRNRERSPKPMDPIRGTLSVNHDGVRDFRVAAGLGVNLRDNTWVEQAKLSDEALLALRYPPH
jgi:hypothetical protein